MLNFTYPKLATQIMTLLMAHEALFPGVETEWTVEEIADTFHTSREAVIHTATEMRLNKLYDRIPHQSIVEGGYSTPWDKDTLDWASTY